MKLQPFKFGMSYKWLLWVWTLPLGVALFADFAVMFGCAVFSRFALLFKTIGICELFIWSVCELLSGCAIDKSYIASVSRTESPTCFWLCIASKITLILILLILWI